MFISSDSTVSSSSTGFCDWQYIKGVLSAQCEWQLIFLLLFFSSCILNVKLEYRVKLTRSYERDSIIRFLVEKNPKFTLDNHLHS